MSERTLKSIFIGLLSLVVLYGLVLVGRSGGGGAPAGAGGVTAFLEGIDTTAVTGVVLQGPDLGPFRLTRSAGVWSVNGFSADSAAVARLLAALTESQVGDLAGSNPANHGRLGVTLDSAWSVEVLSEVGSARVLLGKVGPRFSSSFARVPDEDEVVTLLGDLRAAARGSLRDWRNKVIVRLDTASVGTIQVNGTSESYTLVRDSSGWLVDGEPTRVAALQPLLRELADLKASDFGAASEMEAAADSTRASLVLLDASGIALSTLTLAGGQGDSYIMVSGSEIVFRIPSWRAARLLPESGNLLPDQEDGGDR